MDQTNLQCFNFFCWNFHVPWVAKDFFHIKQTEAKKNRLQTNVPFVCFPLLFNANIAYISSCVDIYLAVA